MKTSHEPTFLEETWRDIEENATPEKAENRLQHRIHRRLQAIMTYARGKCQIANIAKLIGMVDHVAAQKIGEMDTDPETASLEYVEDHIAQPEILSAIAQLEKSMHTRSADVPASNKMTITELVDQMKQAA